MGSMVGVMALNTDFGFILPYRKRFVERNNEPMSTTESQTPDGRNEALAWHFKRIKGDLSIEALRIQMKEAGYDIGTGTLDRMSKGLEGVRATSIRKLAEFAGKEPDELLRMPATRKERVAHGPTPPGQRFDSVTDDEMKMLELFRAMSDEDRVELAEEMRKRAAKWAEVVKKVLAQTKHRSANKT